MKYAFVWGTSCIFSTVNGALHNSDDELWARSADTGLKLRDLDDYDNFVILARAPPRKANTQKSTSNQNLGVARGGVQGTGSRGRGRPRNDAGGGGGRTERGRSRGRGRRGRGDGDTGGEGLIDQVQNEQANAPGSPTRDNQHHNVNDANQANRGGAMARPLAPALPIIHDHAAVRGIREGIRGIARGAVLSNLGRGTGVGQQWAYIRSNAWNRERDQDPGLTSQMHSGQGIAKATASVWASRARGHFHTTHGYVARGGHRDWNANERHTPFPETDQDQHSAVDVWNTHTAEAGATMRGHGTSRHTARVEANGDSRVITNIRKPIGSHAVHETTLSRGGSDRRVTQTTTFKDDEKVNAFIQTNADMNLDQYIWHRTTLEGPGSAVSRATMYPKFNPGDIQIPYNAGANSGAVAVAAARQGAARPPIRLQLANPVPRPQGQDLSPQSQASHLPQHPGVALPSQPELNVPSSSSPTISDTSGGDT